MYLKDKDMFEPDSYPYLTRPVTYVYRILVAVGELFAWRDINPYKVHSIFSLCLNLFSRLM